MRQSPSPEQPAAQASSAALYTQIDRERYSADPVTAGPWSENAQHGSPVAALLLHCMQQLEDAAPLPVARVTIELLRPIPVDELTVRSRVKRAGRRVQLLEAEMFRGVELVALARAWGVAGDAKSVPGADSEPPRPPRTTNKGITIPQLRDRGFHVSGVEADFVTGGFLEPGPATGWIRLLRQVVAGHEATPAQRAVVAADFGNGFSSTVDPAELSFINPDLTVYLSGTPVGEWIAIKSTTHAGSEGFGFAESILYDQKGTIGRAAQSLLFQTRG